jgi:gluconate 2-dehydrogenase gamma chain
MQRSTRRQFCGQAALVSVGALGTVACKMRGSGPAPEAQDAQTQAAQTEAPVALVTFTTATFATLSAVCERLLPRDEDPGALDLGVPHYIDAMLADPELGSVRETLTKAIPQMDRESRKRHDGTAFHEATPAQQDEILGAWQHGVDGSRHVFDVLLSLTLEGAFGDPKYGGNTGGRGFQMIGFRPDPPLKKMGAMPGMNHEDMTHGDGGHGDPNNGDASHG